MRTSQQEIDERSSLTRNNQFELLLFRLGEAPGTEQRELYGINVFKVREILEMPHIVPIVGAQSHVLGVTDIRGQVIPVIDLAAVVGCVPRHGHRILMVTEYARSTQGFAVEEVDDIARLDWKQVLSAEASAVGGLITSIARLDGNVDGGRLVQVLDVEQILRDVLPQHSSPVDPAAVGPLLPLPEGSVILAADDSAVARSLIEQSLDALGARVIMTRTGQEAWDRLNAIAREAQSVGKTAHDRVALVLTDLEMPEMDGFTLTRNIKSDARFRSIPVVIHSSLSGTTNEQHVERVGADAYVAKFVAEELADTLRRVLGYPARAGAMFAA
jgi:two-component system, chemotaxis family, chemotaxis protein CheV